MGSKYREAIQFEADEAGVRGVSFPALLDLYANADETLQIEFTNTFNDLVREGFLHWNPDNRYTSKKNRFE